MSWLSRKQVNSDEYEKLWKEIVSIRSTISSVVTSLNAMETNMRSLRGTVNRKLSYADEEEDDDEEQEEESIKDDNPSNPMEFFTPPGTK